MTQSSAIQAQLDVLRQNLGRCRGALKTVDVAAKLRDRIASRFDNEFTRLENDCQTLESKVTVAQRLDAAWSDLSRIQDESLKVFDEFLAFVQGAFARKAGLDDDVCELTDSLLDDLAKHADVPWGRFTLLDASERYRERAELIRVRYPDVSLWAIPLAAHEFGHYLGPQLRRLKDGQYSYPFQELLKTADASRTYPLHARDWHHFQEHFADVFATWSLGPAYAAALIVLRLSPHEAYRDSLTHPSAAQRVRGVLWTLKTMDDRQVGMLQRPFAAVAALLGDVWREGLKQAGEKECLTDADASLVEQRVGEVFDLLVSTTPRGLELGPGEWLRASGVAAQMADDLAAANWPKGLTRREIVNAAWLARLQATTPSPFALQDIAKRAVLLLHAAEPRGNEK